MRGLTDIERRLLGSIGPCQCRSGRVGASMSRAEVAVAVRLQSRGLLHGETCLILPLPTAHAVVTPLGRTALVADAAARGR